MPETSGTIQLENGAMRAAILNGEVVSLSRDGHEYLHAPTEPGWSHSDTEMFPVIGPTAQTAYRVQVPKGNAIQDQHGLLRELEYTPEEQSDTHVLLVKEYVAGTPVPNSKFPERSTARLLIWPYSFRFEKRVELHSDTLHVSFKIRGDRDMPYMLGYHPAFRITGPGARVKTCHGEVSIEEVMAAGDRALEVADCDSLVLQQDRPIRISCRGFGHFMLWSPDPGMLCMEPVTFYPYTAGATGLHDGFSYLADDPVGFGVELVP